MKNYRNFQRCLFALIVVLAALSITLWIGCSEQFQTPAEPQELQEEIVLSPSDPQVRAVMDVQDRHTDKLLARGGIIGTGTAMTEDGKPAIVVFARNDVLAKRAAVPDILDDIPVRVIVTGEIKALKGPRIKDPKVRHPRPVPIGISTGHPAVTAGTIGCRVTNGSNVFALSNNHVYADENLASLGDAVIQPGTFDGGSSPADDIGTLFDFEPIQFFNTGTCLAHPSTCNVIDAAIALSSTANLESLPKGGYGTPKSGSGVSASVGQQVMKYGRTTRKTKGTVTAINATVDVGYSTGVARFINQIIITPGSFSAGGDSGSLIVAAKEKHRRKAVGLL